MSDRLATVMMRSAMPSRRSAAITPRTIDSGMMMISATKASWIEAHSRCMVSEKTGTPRLYDVPQCSTTKPPSQVDVAREQGPVVADLVVVGGDRAGRGVRAELHAPGVAGHDLQHEEDRASTAAAAPAR